MMLTQGRFFNMIHKQLLYTVILNSVCSKLNANNFRSAFTVDSREAKLFTSGFHSSMSVMSRRRLF